ncbi:RING-box protein 1 [Tyrophagus putrescentiae]|nr:RING-box protein 1 [Tyrophagus putrescentiae]
MADVDNNPIDDVDMESNLNNPEMPSSSTQAVHGRKRFEVKKWSAVALWAWDIVVDNCAICRNHIMDLCIDSRPSLLKCFQHHFFSLKSSHHHHHHQPTITMPVTLLETKLEETLKFETEDGKATVAGPMVGAEAGVKHTANGGNFVAKADLSLVRAEKSLQVAEDLDVYASANLNANTGVEVGADGVEVNFLGLGVTAGVGGNRAKPGGGEAGFKRTEKGGNMTAKAELSLARAEKNFRVTENMGAYLSANLNANTGLEIGADGVEVVLNRAGVNLRQETIKYESEDGSGTVAGPSAGAEAGYKRTVNGGSLAAKAELSLARAEKSFQVTENVDAYASANLNANTGFQAGDDGVEVNVLGFGLTLGVGGRPRESSVRAHITTLNDIKEPSPKSAQVMNKFAEIRQETVKYENEDGTVVLAGPSGGVEAGIKMTTENFCLVTKAELSLARGEKCFPMTDDYGLQVFADLNANTGIEIGTSGQTIKYESEDGSGKVAGPSAGAEAGYKRTEKGENIVLKTELSLARAEKSFQVTENVDAYVSANLNANTGFQAGDDGVEVNLVGFGLTLGVGGRWTINTPFGSMETKKLRFLLLGFPPLSSKSLHHSLLNLRLLRHHHHHHNLKNCCKIMSRKIDDDMETDNEEAVPSTQAVHGRKRFEVKKWSAVALWAWDITVDICAICRNHIMDLCIECQANQARPLRFYRELLGRMMIDR